MTEVVQGQRSVPHIAESEVALEQAFPWGGGRTRATRHRALDRSREAWRSSPGTDCQSRGAVEIVDAARKLGSGESDGDGQRASGGSQFRLQFHRPRGPPHRLRRSHRRHHRRPCSVRRHPARRLVRRARPAALRPSARSTSSRARFAAAARPAASRASASKSDGASPGRHTRRALTFSSPLLRREGLPFWQTHGGANHGEELSKLN